MGNFFDGRKKFLNLVSVLIGATPQQICIIFLDNACIPAYKAPDEWVIVQLAGHRILAPRIKVRVLVTQPNVLIV